VLKLWRLFWKVEHHSCLTRPFSGNFHGFKKSA
jgi:hypothetical protein